MKKMFDKFTKLRKIYKLLKQIPNLIFLLNLSKKNTRFTNIHLLSDPQNMLSKLCEIHGSDKGYVDYESATPFGWKAHTYANFYYNLFNHCKDDIKLVFECGIGSKNEKIPANMSSGGKPGASLRVWRDFFKNSKIYGADIDKNILFEEEKIKTFYVDQLNTNSIKDMWSKININNFDIIIDDGLHTFDANINFFENSFDRLKKNGIYVIEDIFLVDIPKYANKLNKYNIELIALNDEKNKKITNNNLILVRKV